jgi:hypothetical protein
VLPRDSRSIVSAALARVKVSSFSDAVERLALVILVLLGLFIVGFLINIAGIATFLLIVGGMALIIVIKIGIFWIIK